jgi:glyoxylase-like metal-dependent hydrolase (beta-lactamase superfamily II)
MISEALPGIFKIEVPLPHNPLKSLNSFVIKSKGRNLIIDTGMNRDECREAMYSGIKELELDLSKTDFFVTHMHADHSGLVFDLAKESSVIYCSQSDARAINLMSNREVWNNMQDFARENGFPEAELEDAVEKHPGYRYCPRGHGNFQTLKEGDAISVFDYNLVCIETPGHTRGHLCLYDHKHKLLFSGDHVLKDITPNISRWFRDEKNPLGEYLKSLDKVAGLNVNLVLPGHRSIFSNLKERIEELHRHHRQRLDEVLEILSKGEKDAYQVAQLMTWDLTYPTWTGFPVAQKWFATGEALAHLSYLEEQGLVRLREQNGKCVYYNSD